ncbi:MAG: hypothetical protein HYZ16_04785 [Bacteroidetes bacterium]|jgi:hypothetical protein|nr:hypothetical protein [Bacteroidota bacterium]
MKDQFSEIPPHFYDTLTGAPIQECKLCGKNLYFGNEQYVIEKALHKTEVIFEHAVCLPCAEKMRGQLSRVSLRNIDLFLLANARFYQRAERLRDLEFDTDTWLKNCIVNDTTRQDESEYQIVGLFKGSRMVQGQFPYMIGGKALDALQESLSQETKDTLDRFKDDFFNVPPELEHLFRDPKFTLLV